jgi:hypothetical protein
MTEKNPSHLDCGLNGRQKSQFLKNSGFLEIHESYKRKLELNAVKDQNKKILFSTLIKSEDIRKNRVSLYSCVEDHHIFPLNNNGERVMPLSLPGKVRENPLVSDLDIFFRPASSEAQSVLQRTSNPPYQLFSNVKRSKRFKTIA